MKWIDVEFEYPEPGVTVLVTGKGFFNDYESSVQRWELCIDPAHTDHAPHWFQTREMEAYEHFKITHWMPLPERPKETKTIVIDS